jgi:hypothetical protein
MGFEYFDCLCLIVRMLRAHMSFDVVCPPEHSLIFAVGNGTALLESHARLADALIRHVA